MMKSKVNWMQTLAMLPNRLLLGLIAIALIVVTVFLYWFSNKLEDSTVAVTSERRIDITPEQIQSIKNIGEWEFLSVSDEEMVDTTRKGFFTDDHLSRIYYGTLRLGINMQQVKDGWIRHQADSVWVSLPKVGLLSDEFIDEAKTRSFFESGQWKPADREVMLQRAHQKMKAHCLTPINLKNAQQNADEQMHQLLKSMGFNYINIKFDK